MSAPRHKGVHDEGDIPAVCGVRGLRRPGCDGRRDDRGEGRPACPRLHAHRLHRECRCRGAAHRARCVVAVSGTGGRRRCGVVCDVRGGGHERHRADRPDAVRHRICQQGRHDGRGHATGRRRRGGPGCGGRGLHHRLPDGRSRLRADHRAYAAEPLGRVPRVRLRQRLHVGAVRRLCRPDARPARSVSAQEHAGLGRGVLQRLLHHGRSPRRTGERHALHRIRPLPSARAAGHDPVDVPHRSAHPRRLRTGDHRGRRPAGGIPQPLRVRCPLLDA